MTEKNARTFRFGKVHLIALVGLSAFAAGLFYSLPTHSQQTQDDRQARFRQMSKDFEARGLAEAFKGVTTDGTIRGGLFPVGSTGVSTAAVRQAAVTFLDSLTAAQRTKTVFSVDDPEWRKWMNQHFYVRQGVSFKEMSESQREVAFGLMKASLSAKGLKLSRDIMRLDQSLAEINNNFEEYGELLYHITMMGTPSDKEPWGWQIDGHHLIINYFVLGDQVVMTPTFMGSEPVTALDGKYKGLSVMQEEQDLGLALIRALDEPQRKKAIIQTSKPGNNNLGEAYQDNLVLDYTGIKASEFSATQKLRLLGLINEYVRNMRDAHAKVKMDEVRNQIDNTYFAWVGGTEPDSLFYYRVHSPVILIEFDHQAPVGLRSYERGKPTRQHIHSVVRTPNGNDYGKDLLRQHYQQHKHTSTSSH